MPRIPAVPRGDLISKLELLSSFLILNTRSPSSMSTTVSDGLGSDLSSANLVSPASKGCCENFCRLITEFSRTVRMVPLDISKTAFEPEEALMVWPSKRREPTLTFSEGRDCLVALLTTSTVPDKLAIMIAPFGSFACVVIRVRKQKSVGKRKFCIFMGIINLVNYI